MPVALGTIASHHTGTSGPIPTSGLAGWWDADDTATITHSGGAVSQWADKSGSSAHLIKNPSRSAPVTGTRTINGRNVVDFTNAGLERASYVIAQPVTIFTVTQSDTAIPSPNNQIVANTSNSPTVWVYTNTWALFAGAIVTSAVTLDTTPHVTSAVFNSTSSGMWLDGTAILTGVNPGTGGWTSHLRVGGDLGGDSGYWDGTIAEVIIYDRVLSTVERQQVEAHLRGKWGTP